MVATFGFFLPPTVLPVLAGLPCRRLSAGGALAGFAAGIGSGLAFLVYRWIFKLANRGSFQAASIVIPAGITTLVLVAASHTHSGPVIEGRVSNREHAPLGVNRD
jgi:Na+/proline symporter